MKGNDEPKVYVVWSGRETGVFDSWDDCKPLVVGVKGAKYKSFKGITHTEAEQILADGPEQYYGTGTTKKTKEPALRHRDKKGEGARTGLRASKGRNLARCDRRRCLIAGQSGTDGVQRSLRGDGGRGLPQPGLPEGDE